MSSFFGGWEKRFQTLFDPFVVVCVAAKGRSFFFQRFPVVINGGHSVHDRQQVVVQDPAVFVGEHFCHTAGARGQYRRADRKAFRYGERETLVFGEDRHQIGGFHIWIRVLPKTEKMYVLQSVAFLFLHKRTVLVPAAENQPFDIRPALFQYLSGVQHSVEGLLLFQTPGQNNGQLTGAFPREDLRVDRLGGHGADTLGINEVVYHSAFPGAFGKVLQKTLPVALRDEYDPVIGGKKLPPPLRVVPHNVFPYIVINVYPLDLPGMAGLAPCDLFKKD